jgi:ribosome biogenesis GTPase
MDSLATIGWTDELSQQWQRLNNAGMRPARVIADFGTSLKIALPEVRTAELSGRLAHTPAQENIPKIGDWVAVRVSENVPCTIEQILPRHTELARKVAGKRTIKQVIAANIDIAFVLLSLDADFSIERLRRYLYQLASDTIESVIVLNKADKTTQVDTYISRLRNLGLPIIVAEAINGVGTDEIMARIRPGRTGILLGSSGVGKSTLTNQLLGRNTQKTQSIRVSDSTGRHTTVHRELFVLPNGGLLIDTPGIRELQLWGVEADLDENFDDIANFARKCKYRTCHHKNEAGCAVQHALATGALSATHYANYQKMKAELRDLKTKQQYRTQVDNKKSHKSIQKQAAEQRKEMRDEIT